MWRNVGDIYREGNPAGLLHCCCVLADNVEDENCIIPSATKKKDQQNNTNKHFFSFLDLEWLFSVALLSTVALVAELYPAGLTIRGLWHCSGH
jgi:hypothetical protein